jgi:hypothetical protein
MMCRGNRSTQIKSSPEVLFPTDTRGLERVRYGGVLLSAPLHAYVTLHNLLNVPVQIANKMGFQKKT